ncbi:MAG: hypothetical protein J6Q67_04265, partial [Clostridia bacterium]|nr:hypothetical protein [Clostridia bacterium]
MNEFENKNENEILEDEAEVIKAVNEINETELTDEPSKTEEVIKDEATQEEPPFEQPYFEDAPAFNRVNYTDIVPTEDYRRENKGLRIFALIMVCVIVLSGVCTAGYFAGRNSVNGN